MPVSSLARMPRAEGKPASACNPFCRLEIKKARNWSRDDARPHPTAAPSVQHLGTKEAPKAFGCYGIGANQPVDVHGREL
jgi:hypothetical protein